MTREEAVKEIEKAFEPAFANYIITALTEGATASDKELFKPMVDIDLYSVIKQKYIEREVLDKIRAEIWDLQYGDEEKSMTDEDRADAYNNAIRQVIEIIDKYKAESEG